MKEEILDEGYEEAINSSSKKKRPSSDETEESILVAKKIKQELGIDDDEPQEIIVRRIARYTPIIQKNNLKNLENLPLLLYSITLFACGSV